MEIRVVQIGSGPRMERVLRQALDGMPACRVPAEPFPELRDSRILFAVRLDDYGPGPELAVFLRRLRQNRQSRRENQQSCQYAQHFAFSFHLQGHILSSSFFRTIRFQSYIRIFIRGDSKIPFYYTGIQLFSPPLLRNSSVSGILPEHFWCGEFETFLTQNKTKGW